MSPQEPVTSTTGCDMGPHFRIINGAVVRNPRLRLIFFNMLILPVLQEKPELLSDFGQARRWLEGN